MPLRFATRAIHDGQPADPVTGSVNTPVYLTSTYKQAGIGRNQGYVYARTGHPTRAALEAALASLENGTRGFAFASGMSATNTVLTLLKSGDHIVCVDNVYGGTYRALTKIYPQFGLKVSFVDGTRADQVVDAITPATRLVWLETPSNPLLKLVDLRAVIRGVRRKAGRKALIAVDNTFATPYLQTPLDLGADLVMHSVTKYLAGHSDVLAGGLVVKDKALGDRIFFSQNALGAVLGPMDCYLVLRGLKTLAIRMDKHCDNAMAVARHLNRHPQVRRVYYPGLPGHPQHALAKRQMQGFGAMVSFELKGDLRKASRFVASTKLFALGESLGGVKSLMAVPAAMTHASVPREERLRIGIQDGLIRLSVGIEDVRDLIEDLDRAFARARR